MGVVGKRRRYFIEKNDNYKIVAVSDITFQKDTKKNNVYYYKNYENIKNHNLDCVFPTPPHMEDFTSWYAIGETLGTLHTELAGDLKTFQSVVEYCDQSGHTAEVQRWQQLSVLQRSYHDEVDLLGFWDI